MPTPVAGARVASFHRSLESRVSEWLASEEAQGVPCAELYACLPPLYVFLVRLGLDSRLPECERMGVLSALKYIVAPYDLIPEGVVGTSGFRDDLVLAALVVDRLYRVAERGLLDEHWGGPGDPVAVARGVLEARADLVGAELCQRLTEWLPVAGPAAGAVGPS